MEKVFHSDSLMARLPATRYEKVTQFSPSSSMMLLRLWLSIYIFFGDALLPRQMFLLSFYEKIWDEFSGECFFKPRGYRYAEKKRNKKDSRASIAHRLRTRKLFGKFPRKLCRPKTFRRRMGWCEASGEMIIKQNVYDLDSLRLESFLSRYVKHGVEIV